MSARLTAGIAAALCGVAMATGPARAADGVSAGAYCPIPEPGETPGCLDPAKAQYGEFFQAVDAGSTDDAKLASVEQAVASAAGEAEGYLALSSLAYGYYQLSQRAARTPGADPAIATRLERWNELFARVYGADPSARQWREAVREAALDVERHVPPDARACTGPDGAPAPCHGATEALRELDRAADDVGYRGGLEKLLERWLGSDTP